MKGKFLVLSLLIMAKQLGIPHWQLRVLAHVLIHDQNPATVFDWIGFDLKNTIATTQVISLTRLIKVM